MILLHQHLIQMELMQLVMVEYHHTLTMMYSLIIVAIATTTTALPQASIRPVIHHPTATMVSESGCVRHGLGGGTNSSSFDVWS